MGARRTAAVVAGALLAVGTAAGCGAGTPAAPVSGATAGSASSASNPPSTTATSTAATSTAASTASAAAARATASATAGATAARTAPLVVAAAPQHLTGSAHGLDYDISVPVFSGSPAAAEVNRRVLASARDTIAATAAEPPGPGAHHTLDGKGTVTTDDGRTVQVVLEYADYYDGAAHPTDTVATVALTAAAGAPIVLSDVFADQQRAFTALAPRVRSLAQAAGEPVTEGDGLAPRASNWAAWQTTPQGMVLHFQDYQLGGHGLRTYTVPWSDVGPLLTPRARALLAP